MEEIIAPISKEILKAELSEEMCIRDRKGSTRKYLQGMLCTSTTMHTPTIRMTLCWVIGPQLSLIHI